MNQTNEFLAGVLRNGSRALAAYAAGDLLEAHPEAKEQFGPSPFDAWQSCLVRRIDELAVAVAASRPLIFVSQIQWATAALRARGASPDDFRAALTCLRNVCERELPEEGRGLALEYMDAALEASVGELPDRAEQMSSDSPEGRLAASYLVAVLEGDRRRALKMLLDALNGDLTVEDIYLRVIIPAQREIGRMWHATEINVAEEHFVTETTKAAVAQLAQHAVHRPSNGKTVLTASVAANHHDVALRIIAHLFEIDGWRVIHLGADMPIRDLVQAMEFFKAHLLVLSVALNVQLPAVRECVDTIRRCRRVSSVKILVGGHAFGSDGDLALELGADGHGAEAEDAVRLGRELVGLPGRESNR